MTNEIQAPKASTNLLDKPLIASHPTITIEKLVIVLILILAVFSRFYQVDKRVMSHDEVNHVVPAYDLYQGRGYAHDPITHGPFQFHLLAASYFMMGDNDFSARVPAALFSVAAVAFVLLAFPKYLGRKGALLAGLFFLISPYLLYYGRYTRNEAFIELFAVMMLYAVLRYLDKKDVTSMVLLTVSTALHFTTKETAYMYVAEMLIFLALLLFIRLIQSQNWKSSKARGLFIIFSVFAILLFAVTFGAAVKNASIAEVNEDGTAHTIAEENLTATLMVVFGVAFAVAAVGDVIYLINNLGWETIRKEASFDLLMVLGLTVLPLLVAFPVKMLGWDPLDYGTAGMIRTGGTLLIILAVTIALGIWWDTKRFVLHMGIFYAIFTIFYTTFFTNPKGFFTGMVGSLGYWLVQQSVERGTQPEYYYALIQMPIYEYLSIAGLVLAVVVGVKQLLKQFIEGEEEEQQEQLDTQEEFEPVKPKPLHTVPVLPLLLFWSLISLIVFSIAGERMPWLTVHIAIPFSLIAAWGMGKFLDAIDWKKLFNGKTALSVLVIIVLLIAIFGIIGAFIGSNPPFAGKELFQLEATFGFLLLLVIAGICLFALFKLFNGWNGKAVGQLLVLGLFIILTVLTARTAYMAAFPNADYATEFLVYAHATPAPKEILAQIESLSYRITGGKDLDVAYDNDSLYPYWWYFRDYTNVHYFAEQPTRDIADSVVILASSNKYDKIDSIVQDNYVAFDYTRLWWPMQDYFGLTWERISNAFTEPDLRSALFQIWLNRDYTEYAQYKQSGTLTLETWDPADHFRMYIRKDVVAQMWEYGAFPEFENALEEDPYLDNVIAFEPDLVIGADANQFIAPRGLAVAPDGSLYVADSNNHRIQHFAADGTLLHIWGEKVDANTSPELAVGGTFNEPWDVAVDNEGFVYVADTWNYRIQKFTAEGEFIAMWPDPDTVESQNILWGPRSIAVDQSGRVYVTDTGNKRVMVYDTNGTQLTTFGGVGFDPGQFDEPVGLAIDQLNNIYIADTWNRRVQSMWFDAENLYAAPITWWDIHGWYGQSLENKPYVAVSEDGTNVYITDPEGYRVIQFDNMGNYIRSWGDYSPGYDGFGLPAGIAADGSGGVWVSDAGNNVILHFSLPEIETQPPAEEE